jgi:prefoldin beta subunit
MTEDAIQRLSMVEQNLSLIISQKQNFQKQIFEIENALSELKETKSAYQITGAVMIQKDSNEINKFLNSQKETINIRLESLKKQEKILRDEMNELHKKIFKQK